MGDSTGAPGPGVPVTSVFSSRSNKGVPAKATAQLTTDPEGTEGLSILEKGQSVAMRR